MDSYPNLYPDEPWANVRRLRLVDNLIRWKTIEGNGPPWTAKGHDLFVFQQDEILVAKIHLITEFGRWLNHSDLAAGANVQYAGEIQFGSSRSRRGKMKYWNNNSGHYKPAAEDSWKVSSLPQPYFEAIQS